jgi:hypothetical protein
MKFTVWCPEDGEGPEDGRTITAIDAEQAAELWAERDDAEGAEYRIAGGWSEPTVVVSCVDGTQAAFRLTGLSSPVYSAHSEPLGTQSRTSGENISPSKCPD